MATEGIHLPAIYGEATTELDESATSSFLAQVVDLELFCLLWGFMRGSWDAEI
jgi:hypothetical protein